MKTFARILFVCSATCFAFLGSAHAQLVTYQTVSAYDGSQITGFSASGNSATRGQTFTNIEAIASLTYNFFKAGANSSSATFNASFAQWNTTTSTWDTVVSFGSFTVPASSSWTTLTNGNGTYPTFAQTFTFNNLYITNPSATYSLLVTNTSGSNTNFGIGTVFDEFAFGSSSRTSEDNDYTFAQIVLVPGGNIVPAPEASTVAALLAGSMVVALVGFRIRQRRQQALAPVAA